MLDLLVAPLLAATLAAAPADLAVESPWLGVTLTCPPGRCDPGAPFTIDEISLRASLATRGFSTQVIELGAGTSLEAGYSARREALGKQYALTYTRLKPGAFAVLSGLSKDGREIVYEKLVRGAAGPVGLHAVYEAARRTELDPVVARLMSSFQPAAELARLAGGKRLSAADAGERVTSLPDLRKLRKALGKEPMALQFTEVPSPTSRPGAKDARYRVGVGERHADRDVMLYWFQVDGYTGEVLAADPVCDFSLTLEQWRQLEPGESCDDFAEFAR